MTIRQWFKQAETQLAAAGVETARLDAVVLLEDVMGQDRAWLLARPETQIPPVKARKLINLLNRRAEHEPLAYIRGWTEFYGRNFVITPAVLEPRPESEAMIDLFKALIQNRHLGPGNREKLKVADVGAGSGALGITAALEVPNIDVDLLDISPGALKVAKMNVEKFTLKLDVIKSDLLAQANRDYDALLCNLPYVPDTFQINKAAMREPGLAIFGGPDGLDLYRKLFDQLESRPARPLYILTEALPPQHAVLKDIAGRTSYKTLHADGFIQVFANAKIQARSAKTVHKNR